MIWIHYKIVELEFGLKLILGVQEDVMFGGKFL